MDVYCVQISTEFNSIKYINPNIISYNIEMSNTAKSCVDSRLFQLHHATVLYPALCTKSRITEQ